MSWPSTEGVSFGARMVDVGWLPGITLCGTSAGGVPSAATSSAVRPNAESRRLGQAVGHQQVLLVTLVVGRLGEPMKSAGISSVPWWMSW